MTASNLAWQRDIWDYVSDRGRIPQEIRDAYAVADSGAAPACSEERRSLRESGREGTVVDHAGTVEARRSGQTVTCSCGSPVARSRDFACLTVSVSDDWHPSPVTRPRPGGRSLRRSVFERGAEAARPRPVASCVLHWPGHARRRSTVSVQPALASRFHGGAVLEGGP